MMQLHIDAVIANMKHNLFPHSWRVQIIPLPSWQKISLKKTNKREPIAEY